MNAALLLSAIFNGAWQGTLLCLAALLAFRLFRRLNATTMFTVWSVLLAIAVLLPVANYVFAPGVVRVRAEVQAQGSTVPVTVRLSKHERVRDSAGVALRQAQGDKGRDRGDKGRDRGDKGRDLGAKVGAPLDGLGVVRQAHDDTITIAKEAFAYAGWILAGLALIALVRLAVLARDVVHMLKARARVRAIEAPVTLADGIGRPFLFAASDEFTSPCVLGFAPPLIVIPEDLLAEPNAKLSSVVLHEREHVRRFDDIQNVLQRLVGALAFFCPGVRIALRELALYREQICDDAAVNATGDRVSYAMTLTGMAQWAQGRGTPVPSLIFKRKHLLHRLEVLLDSAVSHSMRMNRRFAAGAVTALVIAAALVLRFQVPVVAETLSPVTKVAPVRPLERVRVSGGVTLRQAQDDTVRAQDDTVRAQDDTVRAQDAVRARRLSKVAPVVKVAPVAKVVKVAPRVAARAMVFARVAKSGVATQVAAHAMAFSGVAVAVAPYASAVAAAPVGWHLHSHSDDLLDALSSAGLQNLPVDQLIALRDHGVSGQLVQAAVSYFGHVGAGDLTYLADHGVGPSYIATLRASGVSGITPQAAVDLMDHGVGASLISAAMGYFSPRASAADLVKLADHGVGASYIATLHSAGINGVAVADVVRMFDHGVSGEYIVKVRRVNPHASIDDIIRLFDAGF